MSTEEFLDEIEVIKNDASLSPEEKKKKIKRLRRKIRKHEVKVIDHPQLRKTLEDYLVKLPQEFEKRGIPAKTLFGNGLPPAYTFDLTLANRAGSPPAESFIQKYKARWGMEHPYYEIKQTSSRPTDVYLLMLGPIPQRSGEPAYELADPDDSEVEGSSGEVSEE